MRHSRRGFLGLSGAGLATTAGLVASGCEEQSGPAIGGDPADDVEILNDALALELSVAAAYDALGPELAGEGAETAELFAEQAREHVAALQIEVEDRGGEPVEPLSEEEYASEFGLADLADDQERLDFAVDLESTAIAAYGEAVTQLSEGELRRTIFEILGNSAAHVSVLLGLLGEVQVPDAFVTGAQV